MCVCMCVSVCVCTCASVCQCVCVCVILSTCESCAKPTSGPNTTSRLISPLLVSCLFSCYIKKKKRKIVSTLEQLLQYRPRFESTEINNFSSPLDRERKKESHGPHGGRTHDLRVISTAL